MSASSPTYLLTRLLYPGLNNYNGRVNVAYQQIIPIALLFNSKLNDCAESSKRAGGISKQQ